MFRIIAFITSLVIILLGMFFILLNILDIDEDYRLFLPIAPLNTIFISAVALLVTVIAARNYTATALPEMLGLGGAVLAFGTGILIYSWFTRVALEMRFAVYDGTFLLAGVIHLLGAAILKEKSGLSEKQRRMITLLCYSVICLIIMLGSWQLFSILSPFTVPRGILKGIGAVLYFAAAIVCVLKYRSSRRVFYFWYSLGLMVFAMGILFMAQGALESRIGWLGRIAQYVGGAYFIAAVLAARRPAGKPVVK
jgi:hypothetical protein